LLHGVLLRRSYEGHAVPNAPTSPGENVRVLPAPYERVPEEQMTNPLRRERKLFADDPLAGLWMATTRNIFQQSLHDLTQIWAATDLGRAVFIDRPLGFGKAPLEPDQTPLLAHLTQSRSIARRRMDLLAELAREMGLTLPENWEQARAALDITDVAEGTPIGRCASLERPIAALADAQRVSDDFTVLHTLFDSVRRLRELFDWNSLQSRFSLDNLWKRATLRCMRVAVGRSSVMAISKGALDADQPRILFETDPAQGFRSRGGVELPVAGLRIWEVRDDDGVVHDLRRETVVVLPIW
jgi:hypothetical protein